MRSTLEAGAILAKKYAVVATGGAQAVGPKAQVGQVIGANATFSDTTMQFGTGNTMELKKNLIFKVFDLICCYSNCCRMVGSTSEQEIHVSISAPK